MRSLIYAFICTSVCTLNAKRYRRDHRVKVIVVCRQEMRTLLTLYRAHREYTVCVWYFLPYATLRSAHHRQHTRVQHRIQDIENRVSRVVLYFLGQPASTSPTQTHAHVPFLLALSLAPSTARLRVCVGLDKWLIGRRRFHIQSVRQLNTRAEQSRAERERGRKKKLKTFLPHPNVCSQSALTAHKSCRSDKDAADNK